MTHTKLLRYKLLFCLQIFFFALSYGQKEAVKFTHLTNLDGLSQSNIQAIIKDKYGFMWFGTQDGLNRYDGYNFKVYRHQPNNPGSLRRSFITSLCEDRQGNLWVGTNNGALSLYDRGRDSFIHFKESVGNNAGLSQKTVTAIYEDKQENLWVGTYWKLNLLDRKSGKVTQFGHNAADTTSISNDGITCIYEDSKNNLWVGTVDGLNLFDRKTKKFKQYLHNNADPGSLTNSYIGAIKEDIHGRLWIGTNEGLNLFKPVTQTFDNYKNDTSNPASISNNKVNAIQERRDGKIWVGTADNLELFDPEKNIFFHIPSSTRDATSLNLNANITAMLQDEAGILWVGTYQGGINKYDKYLTYFGVQRNNPNDPKSLSFNIVTSFAENGSGDIWVGTGGGALNLWKPSSNQFIRFNPDPKNKNSLATWGVLCLAQSKRNDYLWIGMYGKCIDRYDPNTNIFKHYTKGDAPNQLNNDAVYALMEDNKGNIWIGTNGGGVNVLDPNTDTISKYVVDPNDQGSLAGDFVRCFYEDKKGNIWIGTTTGISEFNPVTKTFTRFDQSNSQWESDVIFSIYEDIKGSIWMGTQGGGLNRLDPKTKKITCFTITDALPDNTINSILQDDFGYLWLSTNNGISRYDPIKNVFKNYGVYNGVQSSEFSKNAGFKTNNGQILFGGVNGFNSFFPGNFVENKNIPPVVITGFKLFNKPVAIGGKNSPLEQDIIQTKSIKLSYDQSIITFEFAALGFTVSEDNQYAFMLEGFDKKWNYVGTQRSATYTNLDPGNYIFKVKASNNDGVWNEKETVIAINIIPPFWLTWWFKASIILAVLLSGISFYRLRMKAVKSQEKILEQKVKEQTIQLVHSTEEEHKARKEAENARIETELANKGLVLKNKELEQFVYVASHDLQEPLRTTSSFVELIQQKYHGKLDEKADQYLDFISDASNRMRVLIDDLLDFSRIGKKVQVSDIDCNITIKNVLADITAAIQESKSQIQVLQLPVIKGYPTEVKLLFQNLVLNAIKFRKQDIAPQIRISAEKKENNWQFRISDNGIGIEKQHSERIFEIFQRLHTRKLYAGSGIGLAHCKKIVELHHGKIWIESKFGEGSTFYFTLSDLQAVPV